MARFSWPSTDLEKLTLLSCVLKGLWTDFYLRTCKILVKSHAEACLLQQGSICSRKTYLSALYTTSPLQLPNKYLLILWVNKWDEQEPEPEDQQWRGAVLAGIRAIYEVELTARTWQLTWVFLHFHKNISTREDHICLIRISLPMAWIKQYLERSWYSLNIYI